MVKTVAIIGAGQIGYAAFEAFRDEGWDVRVLARTRPEWLGEDGAFEQHILGEGPPPAADVVLDTIAYDAEDVERYDPASVGRYIAISTGSVYADAQGRGFETDPAQGFPEFPSPIPEDTPFVEAGPQNYSSRKVRMELAANDAFGEKTTLLRPCAIHGPYSRQPREWWFVKRLLDGRTRIPLSFAGESIFHTTSARTIGYFALHAAENDLSGPYNVCDDYPPTVKQIGEDIMHCFSIEADLVTVEGSGPIGRTPWSLPNPFVVSGERMVQSGFVNALPYASEVGEAVNWLRDLNPTDWHAAFPVLAGYPYDLFDYAAEDRFFASL